MKKNLFKTISIFSTSVILAACGGDSGSESNPTSDQVTGSCTLNSEQAVNWSRLASGMPADNLSEYGLFQNPCDPTANPSGSRSLEYDMSVPLFTDYSSKYRFVYIPENTQAVFAENYANNALIDASNKTLDQKNYADDDMLQLPVGSVLVKSFAMPTEDTAKRGIENENLIETRILIHRQNGWVVFPYLWNEEKTDAVYLNSGTSLEVSLQHKGEQLNFTYGVPAQPDCGTCHENAGNITPVGIKLRYLNYDHEYADGNVANQIEQWVAKGLLDQTSLPVDMHTEQANDYGLKRYSTPVLRDEMDVEAISGMQELNKYAHAWVDIHCAHCHNGQGEASNTSLSDVSYTRSLASLSNTGFGVCELPISSSPPEWAKNVKEEFIPMNPDDSMFFFRMSLDNVSSDERSLLMPRLGRTISHREGVKLVRRWMESMDQAGCP
jgi:uncharacterized repeat protein (TIGR03806 family)